MIATTTPLPTPLDTLTAEQRQTADRDGFLVVEDILTPDECRMYAARLDEYGTGQRPIPQGMTVQREPRVERGEVVAAAGSDIRKIIRIAETDDLFQGLARHPGLVRILQGLLGPKPELDRPRGSTKTPKGGQSNQRRCGPRGSPLIHQPWTTVAWCMSRVATRVESCR